MQLKLKFAILILLILSLFITQSLAAVTTELKLDGWTKARNPVVYQRNKLTEHLDGGADIYLAYKIQDVTVFEFQKPNGSSIAIDIYNMTLPEDAFGIYSFNRSGSKEVVPVGNEGILSSGLLDFWIDKYYIRVSAGINFKISTTEFINLGNQIATSINAEKGEVPKLVKMLPKKGLVAGSPIYFHKQLILDNIAPEVNKQFDLKLSDKTDAAYAEYNFDSTIGKLIIVEYANPDDMRNALLSQKDTEPIHIGMLKKYFILLINMKPEKEKALITELSDNF